MWFTSTHDQMDVCFREISAVLKVAEGFPVTMQLLETGGKYLFSAKWCHAETGRNDL